MAALARGLRAQSQRLDDVAAGKHQRRHLAFAVAGHFHAVRQRVSDGDAHAVQTAREAVSAALAFVKLAAGVQLGEYQLNHRGVFLRVQAKRNAAAIVVNGDGAIGV